METTPFEKIRLLFWISCNTIKFINQPHLSLINCLNVLNVSNSMYQMFPIFEYNQLKKKGDINGKICYVWNVKIWEENKRGKIDLKVFGRSV